MKTYIKTGMSCRSIISILNTETLTSVELVLFLFDSEQGRFGYFLTYPNRVDDMCITQLKSLQQTIIKHQKNCTKSIKNRMEQSLKEIVNSYNGGVNYKLLNAAKKDVKKLTKSGETLSLIKKNIEVNYPSLGLDWIEDFVKDV